MNVTCPDFRHRLGEARTLHRAGKLAQAEQAYDALLYQHPDSAEVIGLMGVLAFQQRRLTQAETLLRRSLELPADARVQLRNLNNALTLMKEQRRFDEARELIGDDLPEWPPGASPEAGERAMLLSLAEALAFFGSPDRAIAFLQGVIPLIGEDAEALFLAGRLVLRAGDTERAVRLLERAAAADPSNWHILAALGAGHTKLRNRKEAAAAALGAARAAPLYVGPPAETQTTILVFNNAPRKIEHAIRGKLDLHFQANYISQVASRGLSRFRFASVFADLDDPVPELPQADLVINNMASGEWMNVPGRLARARALVDRIGRPVINHPDAVSRATRQANAEGLRGVAGLRVPRIARYRRDASLLDTIVADIESEFRYPLIVRHVAADRSALSLLSERKTALLVKDRNELRSFIEGLDWREFYVVEYVDLRKPDGNFRKLRAMLFPDEVIIGSGGYYSEWMVGGWRRRQAGIEFYTANPHLLDEMNRILLDPEGKLGSHVLPVLEEVRDRVPLDLAGMDFDVDDEGRVVLFEVGATMNFLQHLTAPKEQRMPDELEERINLAFDRMVVRWTGRTG